MADKKLTAAAAKKLTRELAEAEKARSAAERERQASGQPQHNPHPVVEQLYAAARRRSLAEQALRAAVHAELTAALEASLPRIRSKFGLTYDDWRGIYLAWAVDIRTQAREDY